MKCQPIEKGWTAVFRDGYWTLRRQTFEQDLWRGKFQTKQAAQAAAREMVADVRRKERRAASRRGE